MKKQLFIILAAGLLLAQCAFAGESKRVIFDGIDDAGIKELKDVGCVVKHKLKGSSSFDCPAQAVLGPKVRESRVFQISDLAADVRIGADHVWAEGIDGTGAKVAILDTGIDTDHAELAGSYLGGYDYVNNDADPQDDNGHGTHVAGIITGNGATANAKGVAPGAGIYMYKVCNARGNCYEDDMIAAMEFAITTDAKVMSISIGGGSYTTDNCDSDPLAAEVNKVVDSGITVVVAAGNDGKGVSTPGCASKAIAVGAVDSSNNVAYFSGRGPALDIVAPGVSIYSSYKNGGYATMSGTSMATPHVAGAVALLLEANGVLTTAQIKDALYTTTNPVSKCYNVNNVVVTCTSSMTGAGVLDAYNAYLKVKQIAPPQPQCTVDSDCSALSDQCNTGVCDVNLGKCAAQPKTDGTSCGDGLYCNGAETCQSGVCVKGTNVICSALSDQCNAGVCDENLDKCVAQKKADGTACNDGLFCNTGETCQQGVCMGGSPLVCNDGVSCTTDTCNEAIDICDYTWPSCGISDGCCGPQCSGVSGSQNYDVDCTTSVKCWSAANTYLYRDAAQAKKFCKCATGVYKYNTYSYNTRSGKVYRYTDSGNNYNWAVASATSSPVYQVKCSDGKTYKTNQNYYRPL